MSKAGVSPQHAVGTAIPSPADIPHASPPTTNPVPISSTSPSGSTGAGFAGQVGTGSSPTTSSGLSPGAHSTSVGVGHPIGVGTAFGSPSKEPIGTFGGRMQ